MINLRMSSFTYGPIVANPVVPPSLSSLVIPGSEAASAEGAYGKILFQEIHAGEITILYIVYQVKEDLAIDFKCSPGTLQTHVALKNDSQYYISGVGDFYLAEGQFNIIDAPDLEGTYFLEHGKEYHTMHVVFSSEFLDKLLPIFHYLEEWLASDSPRPRPLFKVHSWLSVQLKDVIDRILHCQYKDELLEFYREIKTRELLCLALTPRNGQITPATKLTRRNIALIHESRHLLDRSFDRHLTIAAIAQQIGMNEFKLKAGFKQVFGISMFDYLVKTRMQAARELLLETDKPIKEIASLTGYATKQSFLNAFKKYYHDTPGSFRKN
jgi:AraC family transcriptional regulator, transcriptional activator of the genes for pyochelin and ferripyochelin receptors